MPVRIVHVGPGRLCLRTAAAEASQVRALSTHPDVVALRVESVRTGLVRRPGRREPLEQRRHVRTRHRRSTGTSCGRCSEPGRRRWTRSSPICSSRRLSLPFCLPGHARGRSPEWETGL
ncbi:hypothetical protein E1218_07450 [Kribbella turkmenica]|uniref:Uncharacterized protein n=1 Tax=Kribbella turkmenica TaxID=2530375 RepID=A0A4R4XCC5_9ACTN|nr:hypothetical protein E1218_07450 [Kribbella turkmenica]